MKKLTILMILAFVMFGASGSKAQNNDAEMIRAMLVNAKIAGMCGAIKQMAAFQEATQMPGGNDFLVRFINTEAARLGKDLRAFMQDCVGITKRHGQYMKLWSGK